MCIVELIRQILRNEASAIDRLISDIGEEYAAAIEMLRECKGKIVVTGIGKSGHVGKK
ncbi:hypothetical protein [Paenibacillus dendritiformis]|uniref:hypothetical protein n=1 Tax=Paenibacillus dendritiformis TaxID=130049 RepID=UPI001F55969E|nr:hypothetical protein [Paenibacillus dendritiformis]